MTAISRMQQKRGTSAQWIAANPVLAEGEVGLETDSQRIKIGDGAQSWTQLDYFGGAREDMWAYFTAAITVGPAASYSVVEWNPLEEGLFGGDSPPDLDVDGSVRFTKPGYHLCSISAAGGSTVSEVVTIRVNFNGVFLVPVVQSAHLAGAEGSGLFAVRWSEDSFFDTMRVDVVYRTLAAARSYNLQLGISRIATPHPLAIPNSLLV